MLALIVGVACFASCAKDEPDEAAYVASFKTISRDYAAFVVAFNTSRSPYRPGMTRPQRNEAYSKVAQDAGDQASKLAGREEALQPNARYESVHAEALKLYQLEADRWHSYAKTVLSGDDDLTSQVAKQLDEDCKSQMAKLIAEAENIKEDSTVADSVHRMDLPDPTRNAPRGI